MNFAQARSNMIECQIKPNKVTDPRIIEALSTVPKEKFVQCGMQPVCYLDEDIEVMPGRFLMEPVVFARLLDGAAIKETDILLDVGCLYGYSTAILSKLGNTVIGLENDSKLVDTATKILTDQGCYNAVVYKADLTIGYAKQAPFDVIFMNGAVHSVPAVYLEQLAEGGRLVCVEADTQALGRAVCYTKMGGHVSSRTLFDCSVPFIPGLEPKKGFVF